MCIILVSSAGRANGIVTYRKRKPDFPEAPAYPLDYGFLENTSSMDGEGIDCFVGSLNDSTVNGILCTVDISKKDSEIKVLIGCTDDEMGVAYEHLNKPKFFKAILVKRKFVI